MPPPGDQREQFVGGFLRNVLLNFILFESGQVLALSFEDAGAASAAFHFLIDALHGIGSAEFFLVFDWQRRCRLVLHL